MKNFIFVLFATLLMSTSAFAQQWGIFGEINSSEIDVPNADRSMGIGAGASYLHTLKNSWYLRTGAGLVQKNSEVDNRNGDYDIEFLYLEVPLTFMYAFTPTFGGFGGFNFDLTVDDDCGSSSCYDDEALVTNLVLGGRFVVTPQINIEGYFEFGMTDMYSNVELDNSLGARFIYRL